MAISKVKKVKIVKSADHTYNGCLAGIIEGKTQVEILDELEISKPTLKDHLILKGTSWRDLSKQYGGKKKSKVKVSKGKVSPKKQIFSNPPAKTPPAQTSDPDLDPDNNSDQSQDQEKEPNINEQFKELVDHAVYAYDKGIKASTSDILRYYKETKQLENEERDFERDIDFLGSVEGLIRNVGDLQVLCDVKDLEEE